jgi:hypothetical protein
MNNKSSYIARKQIEKCLGELLRISLYQMPTRRGRGRTLPTRLEGALSTPAATVAAGFGVNLRTARKWMSRYRQGGVAALAFLFFAAKTAAEKERAIERAEPYPH